MLFNCLNCCKSISSLNKLCPYCMVDVDEAILRVGIERKPMPLEVYLTRKEKRSIRLLLADMMDRTVFNVTQLMHVKRISKTKMP